MGDMLDWAKKEVEIACKKENPNRKEGEFNFPCSCYKSALKAFESLLEDGLSGFSIKMTQAILIRLLNGQPLTPIEDIEDIWNVCSFSDILAHGIDVYQCKRMSSLFKHIYFDGTVKYYDVDNSYCVDINNPSNTYSSSLVRKLIDEMFPIKMPYMPGKPIAVYCEDFLTDKKHGNFDTVGVFYALKTENGKQEKIEINRFFKKPEGDEEGDWTEISKEEYEERKARKISGGK